MLQGRATVTIHVIPTIVAIGALPLWVTRSLLILFLYREESANE